MFCREASLVHQVGSAFTAHPLYCESWRCPICIPRRLHRLTKECQAGQPTTFLTLTVNPDRYSGPAERARELVKAWRDLRRFIIREGHCEKIPFIAIFETTKRGEPHLHILCRLPYVPQKKISDFMARRMGAPIVDIKAIRTQRGVARYVSKYVSKAPEPFEGCKRYWRSLDYLEDGPDEPIMDEHSRGEWYVTKACLDDLAALWKYAGRTVVRDGDEVRAYSSWPGP